MAYKYNNCFMVLLKQHKKQKNMVIELTLSLVITCYNEVQVAHGDLVLASSAHSVWSGSVGLFIFNPYKI